MKYRLILVSSVSIFVATPALAASIDRGHNFCPDALAGFLSEDDRGRYYGDTLLNEFRKYVRNEATEFFPGASGFIGDQRSEGIDQDLATYARSLDRNEFSAFKRGCAIAISKIDLNDDLDVRVGELILNVSARVGATSVFAPLNKMKFPERVTGHLREFLQLTLEFAEGAAELEPVSINQYLRKCLTTPTYVAGGGDPARVLVGLTATVPDRFPEFFKLLEIDLNRHYGIDTKIYPDQVAQGRSLLLEDLRLYVRDEATLREPLSYRASAAWWALALGVP